MIEQFIKNIKAFFPPETHTEAIREDNLYIPLNNSLNTIQSDTRAIIKMLYEVKHTM